MKKKQMMLATATVPMLATGLVLPMGNESVVQKVQAEGLTESQKQQFVDGESFWQDKYNPWGIYFTTRGLHNNNPQDVYYDGEKMVYKKALTEAGYDLGYLTTSKGTTFRYKAPSRENVNGKYNEETKMFEPFTLKDNPFALFNATYIPDVYEMVEVNGRIIAKSRVMNKEVYTMSDDEGKTWTDFTNNISKMGTRIVLTTEGDKFVLRHNQNGVDMISESSDGVNWTKKYDVPALNSSIYEHNGTITVLDLSNPYVYTSTDDGKTFTKHTRNVGTGIYFYHMNGKFLSRDDTTDSVYFSSNGIDWKKTDDSVNGIRNIYLDKKNDRFIALGANYVHISKDGSDWTTLDVNVPEGVQTLRFSNDYDFVPLKEKKVPMKTVNDGLPLGEKIWKSTPHLFFSYINMPKNLPIEMNRLHQSIGGYQNITIRANGKILRGTIGNGISIATPYQSPSNPLLTLNRWDARYVSSMGLSDMKILKDGRIAVAYKNPYKGNQPGVAFFDTSELTDGKTGEVLPKSITTLGKNGFVPSKVFEGDGWIGVVSVKVVSGKVESILHVSRDGGKTWEDSNVLSGRIQDMVENLEGEIVLLGEGGAFTGNLIIAKSADGGKTFENIQGLPTLKNPNGELHRGQSHTIAYRDGVYVLGWGSPFYSTDLVNWKPVKMRKELWSITNTEREAIVDYDPIHDAFVLSVENYVGLSRDGVNWREQLVHSERNKNNYDYGYTFLSMQVTSDAISKNEYPVPAWKAGLSSKDEIAPTANVSLSSEEWTNKHATIQVSNIEDAGEGFDYMILPDGTISKESSIEFIATENGSYTFKLYDKSGNVQEYKVEVKNIDKTPAEVVVEAPTNGWTNEVLAVKVKATDIDSGLAYIELPNGEKIESDEATFEAVRNGDYLFKIMDKAGNIKEEVITITTIDNDAPEISVSSSTIDWTKDNLTLNISAIDSLSGLSYIELPNGEKVSNDTTEYTVSKNGEYVFHAVDAVGNKNEYRYVVNNIDNTSATATIEADTTSTTKENVSLTIQAKDKESGVQMITLPSGDVVEDDIAEFTATENGVYTFIVKDKAGNVSEFSYEVKNIDRTPGETTLTNGTEGWSNHKVTVTVKASDVGSGVDYVLTPDGEKVYSESFNYELSENGKYSFVTVDKAGNEWTQSIEVKNIDRNPGKGTITPSTTKSTNAKFGVVLTATATDAESGVEFIVLPDGTIVEAENASFKVHENGKYTFGFIDRAGNAWESSYEVTNLKGKAYWVHQHIVTDWYEHFKKKVIFIKDFLRWLF